jgi:NAD(P)-dependent dehydrogenase (short-subunit alcohol dehydrogenase family)
MESLVGCFNAEIERVAILVNRAAVYARAKFIRAPVEEFERSYNVNIRGPSASPRDYSLPC